VQLSRQSAISSGRNIWFLQYVQDFTEKKKQEVIESYKVLGLILVLIGRGSDDYWLHKHTAFTNPDINNLKKSQMPPLVSILFEQILSGDCKLLILHKSSISSEVFGCTHLFIGNASLFKQNLTAVVKYYNGIRSS
jgi:hypothetical protein